MKTVSDTIGVSRSNLAEQTRKHRNTLSKALRSHTPSLAMLPRCPSFAGWSTGGRPMAIGASRRCRPSTASGAAHHADQSSGSDAPYRLPPGPEPMTVSSSRCAPTSADARTISNSNAATAILAAGRSSVTFQTGLYRTPHHNLPLSWPQSGK